MIEGIITTLIGGLLVIVIVGAFKKRSEIIQRLRRRKVRTEYLYLMDLTLNALNHTEEALSINFRLILTERIVGIHQERKIDRLYKGREAKREEEIKSIEKQIEKTEKEHEELREKYDESIKKLQETRKKIHQTIDQIQEGNWKIVRKRRNQ